jgi:hypothetical protein
MKNLTRLILALFATLLVAGSARASLISSSADLRSHTCAMPDDGGSDNPDEHF